MGKREDRLYYIASEAKKRGINPKNSTIFANLAYKVACGNFFVTRAVAKQDIDILILAWDANKWKTLLGEDYEPKPLTPEPPKVIYETPSPISQDINDTMEKIAATATFDDVKRVAVRVSKQKDHIDREDIAQTLYNKALSDASDGVGRLLLFEVRDVADDKHLQAQDLLALWREFFPLIPIDQCTGNVFKIYFNDKRLVEKLRGAREPILLEQENFVAVEPSVDVEESLVEEDEEEIL